MESFSQSCPTNIGFETGKFDNWQTYTGFVTKKSTKNVITLTPSAPTSGRHTIMSSPTEKDRYGNFPVLAPNGSKYSVKLGNDGVGANAEGISYKLKVPNDKPEFTLNYQYAVVFQDPSHPAIQQPRFNAKVLDLSTNEYIKCASFEYIATSSLPGFKSAKSGVSVLYKDWTAVTLNLSGYQGKELLLEFTTADCTETGHFGYAYIDVNENCDGIIKGNEICATTTNVTLIGPAGYQDYIWYNADKSLKYGHGEQFTFNQVFQEGTKILLDIIPYEGFGCPNTVSTVIIKKDVEVKLSSDLRYCLNDKIDLMSSDIILNKSQDLTYKWFTDAALNIPVADPNNINKTGVYYVKGSTSNGCYDIKSIRIEVKDLMEDTEILSSVKICKSTLIDLSSSAVIKRIPSNLTVGYFFDKNTLNRISDPTKLSIGTYYIKISGQGCSLTQEIKVSYYDDVVFRVTQPDPICVGATIDITNPKYYVGSESGLNLEYFTDQAYTIPVNNAKMVALAGTYFIRATNRNGCIAFSSLTVIVENPVLFAKNPDFVCYPLTVDITKKSLYVGSTEKVTYSFYDTDGNLVSNPTAVNRSGKYKVVLTNPYGCTDSKEIEVYISPLPYIKITNPKRTLEPYTIDLTNPAIISGSGNYEKIEYFEDANLTTRLTSPDKIAVSGSYYIALYNRLGCYVVGKVDILIGKKPLVKVPTGFTPLKQTNNKLYPFFTSLKKVNSFKIYNKWGNLVFETTSMKPEDGWDGFYKGKLQPFETYTWYLEGIDEIDERYKANGKTILIQ